MANRRYVNKYISKQSFFVNDKLSSLEKSALSAGYLGNKTAKSCNVHLESN